MHEISVALEILDTLEDNGYLKGVKKVDSIKLIIGRYSGIDKNYLSFAFQNINDERFKEVSLEFISNDSDEIKIEEIIVD
ncbi:MAG: hydrogenase maturation nickel metallochaperone HypA [Candidatus Acidulodesulfobacterium acidiphilum]|jgi:Zn finger protein HypA/HybF involved in hydrogenase expression|uniref:Hydrogenase maturation nickel metallochaperone HypA n=1 Tax=Candidatus Acidulodesulfobacterium acidiphilum TaxID=2597224 RepID=A0A520X7E9_9DELT|nr:MAG: hydrogenase maturation nickel metallochaperone HypA [Candidatus Acidulodesulfobacterium acidiphilum]